MAEFQNNRMTEKSASASPQISKDPETPVILTVVANWLMGDRVLAFAGMHFIDFAFVTQATGTVRKVYLREAGLSDLRKEIVTILTTLRKAYEILEDLKIELHLEEAHSGIAFIRRALVSEETGEATGEGRLMGDPDKVEFRAIYVVVKKGFAENVISAGERAGTKGATVIPARGEPKEGRIPGLLLSDDKEVILVITDKDKTTKFLAVISEDQEIMKRGEAKVFVNEIIDTVGITYF